MRKYILLFLIYVSTSFALLGQGEFYYAFDEQVALTPTGATLILTNRPINTDTGNILLNLYPNLISVLDNYALRVIDPNIVEPIQNYVSVRGAFPEYLTPDDVRIAIRNEVIVKFKPEVTPAEIEAYLSQINATILSERDRRYLLEPPAGTSSLLYANTIYERGLAIYSHPNFQSNVQLHRYIPNDTYFDWQFYLHNTGQTINDGHTGTTDADIDAPEAWDITRGNNTITVAVIDEGLTNNHPDLPGTRQIRLPGSNFAALVGSGTADDPEPADDGNHGNSCAGVIAATQDNNEGISGIAPNVNIMPIRMQFGWGGSSDGDFADAIRLAYNNGADIISNSWGGGAYSPDIVDAIQDATTLGRGGLGSVVVFSAGNTADHAGGYSGYVAFPGNVNVNGVITVGSSDRDDSQANYSPTSTVLDIVAPSHRAYSSQIAGETWEVWSIDIPGNDGYNDAPSTDGFGGTLPIPGEQLPNAGTNFESYTGRFGGTSAAAPQVAATAALVLSIDPTLTQQEVFDILMCSAEEVGGYTYTGGVSDELGNGRINAFRAVMLACPASYTIDWVLEQFTEIEYTASNHITATNLIETDTDVEYHADNYVELAPGFETTAGAVFSAHIEMCTNCDDIVAPASIVVASDPETTILFDDIVRTDQQSDDFNVFPNPGIGVFSIGIKASNIDTYMLRVFDIQGRQVMTVENSRSVDLSQEPTGLYFFRFSYANQVVTKKVMVHRP